jgi:hypothetical protein
MLKFSAINLILISILLQKSCGENKIIISNLKVIPEKGATNCISEYLVVEGTEYTCLDGTKKIGKFIVDFADLCKIDGQVGCLSNSDFIATDISLLIPDNIREGIKIGGVNGALPPPE